MLKRLKCIHQRLTMNAFQPQIELTQHAGGLIQPQIVRLTFDSPVRDYFQRNAF